MPEAKQAAALQLITWIIICAVSTTLLPVCGWWPVTDCPCNAHPCAFLHSPVFGSRQARHGYGVGHLCQAGHCCGRSTLLKTTFNTHGKSLQMGKSSALSALSLACMRCMHHGSTNTLVHL